MENHNCTIKLCDVILSRNTWLWESALYARWMECMTFILKGYVHFLPPSSLPCLLPKLLLQYAIFCSLSLRLGVLTIQL